MNRIDTLFAKKKEKVLSIYFTAGFPHLDDTTVIIEELSNAGVDIIEIGIPFSDPLADGETIQKSSQEAIKNGMSLKKIFEQLHNIREVTNVPLLLMGYLNTIMQYGIENFCKKCREIGIDGTIIPDLPIDEYEENYKDVFQKNKLKNIFLITPQTLDGRVKYIDEISDAFIYMVSSAAITGIKKDIKNSQVTYFKRIKNMNLKNPRLIGFGISDKKTFLQACNYANGTIIGSAFVKALTKNDNIKKNSRNFIAGLKE